MLQTAHTTYKCPPYAT